MSFLKLDNFAAGYNSDKPIIQGLSFDINQPELHLIIGPNGAGKSTLLKSILGLTTHIKGTLSICGNISTTMKHKERATLVSYVPQALDLQFDMLVDEYVALARFAHNETPSETRKITDNCLERVGADNLKGAMMRELSGGEQRRVIIAAALSQQPSLLLLDEPGTSLDPAHLIGFRKLLAELVEESNIAMLMVTHDWNPYLPLAAKVHGIKAGTKLFSVDSSALEYQLKDLFECDFQVLNHQGFRWALPNFN